MDKHDGGYAVETALKNAVETRKNFNRFADTARFWVSQLDMSDDEKQQLLKRIAQDIREFNYD